MNDVYESTILLNNYKKLDKSAKSKMCENVLNFLDDSGAAKNTKRSSVTKNNSIYEQEILLNWIYIYIYRI